MKEMQYLSTHYKYGREILRGFFFFFLCFFGICFNAAWIYSEMSWEVSTIKMTKYKHKKLNLCTLDQADGYPAPASSPFLLGTNYTSMHDSKGASFHSSPSECVWFQRFS